MSYLEIGLLSLRDGAFAVLGPLGFRFLEVAPEAGLESFLGGFTGAVLLPPPPPPVLGSKGPVSLFLLPGPPPSLPGGFCAFFLSFGLETGAVLLFGGGGTSGGFGNAGACLGLTCPAPPLEEVVIGGRGGGAARRGPTCCGAAIGVIGGVGLRTGRPPRGGA